MGGDTKLNRVSSGNENGKLTLVLGLGKNLEPPPAP